MRKKATTQAENKQYAAGQKVAMRKLVDAFCRGLKPPPLDETDSPAHSRRADKGCERSKIHD